MVSDSNRGQSDDCPGTTDAEAQTTNNNNNDNGDDSGADVPGTITKDGIVGSTIPVDGESPSEEDIEALQEDGDQGEEEVATEGFEEAIEECFSGLENDVEFESRIEEIVESSGGEVPEEPLAHQLAVEFDEEPERVLDAFEEVASINDDGDVTGVASGLERAQKSGFWTLERVSAAYRRGPFDVPADDVRRKSDVRKWAREKLVDVLNREHHWIHLKDDTHGIDEFLWYNPELGHFVEDAKSELGRIMDEHLGRFSTTHEVNETARKLKDANKVGDVEVMNAGDEPLRCLKNGVLNVETWEFTEGFSPEHKFTRRVNTRWDPDVDTGEVRGFLDDITEGDIDRKVLEEMMGDCLTDHYKRQWFGMLYGNGANGKSVLLKALRAVLGKENCSSESLHDIAETRWASAQMAGGTGAWANIDPEVSDKKIHNTAPIKNNTGGDATSHEFKGQDKFSSVNTAKMLFGMNKPSVFAEEKHAIVRRLKPVELPYQFLPPEEVDESDPYQKFRDPDMEERLKQPDNRAALLQVMAEGLQRLQENGDFSYERSEQELFDEYQSAADTFWRFQRDCLKNVRTTHTDTDSPIYLTFNELHSAYASFCQELNESPMAESSFAQELNKIGRLDIEKYHPADADGANSRKYLAFTDTGFEHAMTSTLKRFATRVSDDDVDVPALDDDGGSSGSNTDADGGDTLLGDVVSAIVQIGNARSSAVSHATILSKVDDQIDEVAELDALLMKAVREGKVEMVDDGYRIPSDDDSESGDK